MRRRSRSSNTWRKLGPRGTHHPREEDGPRMAHDAVLSARVCRSTRVRGIVAGAADSRGSCWGDAERPQHLECLALCWFRPCGVSLKWRARVLRVDFLNSLSSVVCVSKKVTLQTKNRRPENRPQTPAVMVPRVTPLPRRPADKNSLLSPRHRFQGLQLQELLSLQSRHSRSQPPAAREHLSERSVARRATIDAR